ncbi:MAG: ribulose-phosphate 3-epimerase [Solobacterium sp.]|nr:ribulose-phosphate 3-epimerase [Solobacterium sp.]
MIVAPSVLSLDYARMKEQVEELNDSGAEWIHFDVMDGHFVPNLTFGPDILKGFKKISPLTMDVHLMVTDPAFFAGVFLDAGADIITFHVEALNNEDDIHGLAKMIHERGAKAGLSLKPGTDLSVLKPFLKDFDLFLIMSVEPGFGGQAFMPEAGERIMILRRWLDLTGSKTLIEVDGGINEETGRLCRQAGADVLVAGSYVFKHDIRKAVSSLAG